ncbi:response regulator [Pontimicrobium aquaticum]|uniref:response regulator n=1 Tax=Pontimicrobium aquaticum TaxID=2565367 RepID=UPI003741F12C
MLDDNKIDCFINKKIISVIFPNIKTTVFNQGLDLINFFKKDITYKEIPIPNIILIDINMPFINGFECINQLSVLNTFKKNTIDVYFLSSSQNKEDISKALNIESCIGYINKPLTKNKLEEILIKTRKGN